MKMKNLPSHSLSELEIAGSLLKKDFGTCWPEQTDWRNVNELIDNIRNVIRPMLNYQMDKLLNIFYRLDLDENKVKTILSSSDPEQMETALAVLILKRELEKAKWRYTQ